jgi:hypothetical protein
MFEKPHHLLVFFRGDVSEDVVSFAVEYHNCVVKMVVL